MLEFGLDVLDDLDEVLATLFGQRRLTFKGVLMEPFEVLFESDLIVVAQYLLLLPPVDTLVFVGGSLRQL
jgi:hypothetical protein